MMKLFELLKETAVSGILNLRTFLFRYVPVSQDIYNRLIRRLVHPEWYRPSRETFPKNGNFPYGEGDEHVLLVSHFADGSGAPLLLLNIARQMFGRGKNLHTILLRDGVLRDKFQQYGDVFVAPRESDFREVLNRLAPCAIKRALLNTTISGGCARLIREQGMTAVVLIHELFETVDSMGQRRAAETALRYGSHFVVPSSLVVDSWHQAGFDFPKDRTSIIPQPDYHADLERIPACLVKQERSQLRRQLRLPKDAKIVIGCGFVEARKGVDVFFKVAKEIIGVDSNVCFLWIGDLGAGYYVRKMMRYANQLGNRARILPYQQLNRFYYGADVFFLPSRSDPFPTVALLAAKTALPICFYYAGTGIRDLFLGIVPCCVKEYTVGHFVASLRALLGDASLSCSCGEEFQRIYSERMYSFPEYVDKIMNLDIDSR